jgi:glycosyltransferase XagB
MRGQINLQTSADTAVVIDASVAGSMDKTKLLKLLKKYGVRVDAVRSSDVSLEEVIPLLRKAKADIPESFFKAFSMNLGLPFEKFSDIKANFHDELKSKLITVIPYAIISKYKIIPLNVKGSELDVAIDNPLDKKVIVTIRYLFAPWNIHLHVVSSEAIDWAIENIFSKIHKKSAMLDLYNRTPDQSAHKVLYRNQKIFVILLFVTISISVVIYAALSLIILLALTTLVYFIFNPVKIYISLKGFKGARKQVDAKIEEQNISDNDLPIYSVLVPIFSEAKILPKLLLNLYNLNYPKGKLDIKILMEETDEETINEAKMLGLFGSSRKSIEGIKNGDNANFLKSIDPIIIPVAKITTKPRACNYGLLRAKGELCVIYDAEDKPDPEQLRKAASIFHHSTEDVVCLQSKLNFYNANENLLTKWFSIEYANWYEFYLQGLDWIEAPIPLGGTSNHFRKKSLDELGRWDPYNVTEDADIGIRLARRNLKTQMIDSYTYEEAPVSAKSWIKQRSRWYKGHLQTYLVHMRHPRKLVKDLGIEKFLKLQATFGASVFIPIINPILWIFTIGSILFPITLGWLTPNFLASIGLFNLLVGNASYLLIYVIACAKLKKYRYLPYAILMPAYWVLLSIASWRGLIQLIRKPFYWDKTSHGISKFI